MTNGKKIKEVFSNLEISPDPYSPSVDIYIGGIMLMRVDRNWWNAEYKEPTTKNKVLDKIRAEIQDTGAYEQEVNGKTEFLNGITYCLNIIDKYKAESEDT